MEGIDRAQIISGKWRMIEENCVLVGPFQSLIGQRLAENIESQDVVRTEGIPRNQKLCDERDSRGNKNSLTAIGATIADLFCGGATVISPGTESVVDMVENQSSKLRKVALTCFSSFDTGFGPNPRR